MVHTVNHKTEQCGYSSKRLETYPARRGRALALAILLASTSSLKLPTVDAFAPPSALSNVEPTTFGTRLDMVATSPSSTTQHQKGQQVTAESGITSTLISQLAVIALKKRLAAQSGVKVDVTITSPTDLLLGGRVGPVTVRGRSWQSPLRLTCRAIEATVESCELDMSAVVTRRKLVLTKPALGDAMIALDATDFGNFVTHPLLRPPSAFGSSGEVMKFHKENVNVSSDGIVTFYGEYSGRRWQLTLQRRQGDQENCAVINVTPIGPPPADDADRQVALELSASLTDFFNSLVFELDGTFLSFRDMKITTKGGRPILMLALDIKVHKFPSLGTAF